jgi:hypothetical protein
VSFAVLDCNYKDQSVQGLAASWLRWEAHRANIPLVEPSEADIILTTVSSQQGISDLKRAIKSLRGAIVLGGGGAYAPAIFDPYIRCACVGEGARFVQTLFRAGTAAAYALPEAWCPGEDRAVIPNQDFPWDIPPLQHPDGTIRLFGARGCRYRCAFCQTGWEQGYHANPDLQTLERRFLALERAQRRVAVVTNDGGDGHAGGGQQEFLSIRFDGLVPLLPTLTRAKCKSVRIGVEGVSERLRDAVGKPVPTNELVDVCHLLAARGIGVRLFFITGLPGESADDYIEMRSLIQGLSRNEKGAIMLNFHAFIPQPATPLCIPPLEDFYWERFEDLRRWFFDGPGFTRRVQIIPPARYKGRIARACESMAASESELRRGWWEHDNVNWRVRYTATPDQLRAHATQYLACLGSS